MLNTRLWYFNLDAPISLNSLRLALASGRILCVPSRNLYTFNHQDKYFYLNHGYKIFDVIENFPTECKRYFMKKYYENLWAKTIKNQGKSYDKIAEGFARMRDSFNTEQKYLDALINYIPKKSHILDIDCGSGFPIANYLIEKNFSVTGIDGS